jgi:glycosyltransferase involved in cell wall biosynthesis
VRIAIITTHPIQYYAPLFQALTKVENLSLKVFYTWGSTVLEEKFDPDFGKSIQWDIPLLDGYDYHFTKNTAKNPGSARFNGIITPDLIEEVSSYSPDAILIYGYAYQGHLKLMRYFKGKVSIWFRGDSTLLDQDFGWKKYVKRIYLYWVYRHIDKALYVGKNNKAYFERFGVKKTQLHFVPHTIDNARFASDRKNEASELRQHIGIKTSEILVLFAGKLEAKKNPLLLMNVAKSLNRTDVHFLFVGNGELENRLKADASTLPSTPLRVTFRGVTTEEIPHEVTTETSLQSMCNRVHFMDFQNQQNMPVIYQACDLFCLPSKGPGETWGLAVNEAMAAGKAVIVSDKVGCAVDLIEEGVNGFTFKSEDEKDLSIKLNALLDKETLIKMGDRSREKIKNWSLKTQVKYITNLWK